MPRRVFVDDDNEAFNKANLRKSPLSPKEQGENETRKKANRSNHGYVPGLVTMRMTRFRARKWTKKNRDLNVHDERQRKIGDSNDFEKLRKDARKADAEEQSYMTEEAEKSYWDDSYGEWEW